MGKTDEKVFTVFEAHADEFDVTAPTLKQLAAATGLSPSSVQRAIRALIRTGRLERVTKGGGVGMSSVYRIHRISTGPESRHLNLVTEPSHEHSQKHSHDVQNKPSQDELSALSLRSREREGGIRLEPNENRAEWHPSEGPQYQPPWQEMREKARRGQAIQRSGRWGEPQS